MTSCLLTFVLKACQKKLSDFFFLAPPSKTSAWLQSKAGKTRKPHQRDQERNAVRIRRSLQWKEKNFSKGFSLKRTFDYSQIIVLFQVAFKTPSTLNVEFLCRLRFDSTAQRDKSRCLSLQSGAGFVQQRVLFQRRLNTDHRLCHHQHYYNNLVFRSQPDSAENLSPS